jgi:hypothetical protein
LVGLEHGSRIYISNKFSGGTTSGAGPRTILGESLLYWNIDSTLRSSSRWFGAAQRRGLQVIHNYTTEYCSKRV